MYVGQLLEEESLDPFTSSSGRCDLGFYLGRGKISESVSYTHLTLPTKRIV